MSTTPLPPLPFEILSQILSYLPPSSLRSARLTSRTLAKIGAHHLLSRIYLAPRPATLAAFTSITQHPIFSRTITEIVYDDTLLEATLTHKEAHEAAVIRRALDEGRAMPEEEMLRESWERYGRGFGEQERLLGGGEFERAVREGVRRLVKLKKVTMVGSASLETRFASLAPADDGNDEEEGDASLPGTQRLEPSEQPNLHWYMTKGPLAIDCAGTLPPSTWGTFNDWREDPSGWDDWFAEEEHERVRVDDARGRCMLLWVLEEMGKKVEVGWVGEGEVRALVGGKGEEVGVGVGEGEIERLLEDDEGLAEEEEVDEDWFSLIE